MAALAAKSCLAQCRGQRRELFPWGCVCGPQRVLNCLPPPQEYKETSHVLLPQHGHQSPAFYSLFSRKQTLGGRSQLWLVAIPQYPVRAGPAWYLNRINKAGGGGPRDRKQRRPSAASFLCLPATCLYPLRRGQESPPGHPQAQALAVRNSDGGLATGSMPTWLPFQLSTSARLKI